VSGFWLLVNGAWLLAAGSWSLVVGSWLFKTKNLMLATWKLNHHIIELFADTCFYQ
jgi:hypothetical protein